MQRKLNPGRGIGIGQILVRQAGHGADEGLRITAHSQSILIRFDLPPASPTVGQRHRHQTEDG